MNVSRDWVVFVSPRFSGAGAVGGAETLLYQLARSVQASGRQAVLLSTCARSHYTWANDLPAGESVYQGLPVHLFPVNADRDVECFLSLQSRIDRGQTLSDAEEARFLSNSVNSAGLEAWIRRYAGHIDRVVAGPYPFGLTEAVSRLLPERTLLVPCLHDEPVARLGRIGAQFRRVRGCLFNTGPERLLAHRLYGPPRHVDAIVGMGISDFQADGPAFCRRHSLNPPYVIYAGRREPLKGTPLLLDYLTAFRARNPHDLKLVLTGSGAINPPEALRPHLLDLGYVSESEKLDAMAGAVAFCHPSLNESLSIVLLEAWLAGTPALVHARGTVLMDQCRRSNGGLWFSDYPEFEAALRLLLEQDELCSVLATNGRAYVRREYAPEVVSRRLLEALTR